jgi:hypothetical protein
MSAIGRIQWSHRGVTIYDREKGFITRIEDERDIFVFNEYVKEALKQISAEMQRRREFKGEHNGKDAPAVREVPEVSHERPGPGQGRVDGQEAVQVDAERPRVSEEIEEEVGADIFAPA